MPRLLDAARAGLSAAELRPLLVEFPVASVPGTRAAAAPPPPPAAELVAALASIDATLTTAASAKRGARANARAVARSKRSAQMKAVHAAPWVPGVWQQLK